MAYLLGVHNRTIATQGKPFTERRPLPVW